MKNSAFLFARIFLKKEEEVLSEVQKINGVDYAVLLFGKEDLLARVSAEDVESLYRTVLSQIRKVPGLQLTKTFVCKPGRE
ncbi:MAG: Lrp/AsnC ligand binding domain-containing protein [archaeon]